MVTTFERLQSSRGAGIQGPAALLLQMLHPLVAAGVESTGLLRHNPLERLRSTGKAAHAILAGDKAAIARIRKIHSNIRGTLPQAVGMWSAGQPYCAADSHLLVWVFATLIQTRIESCAKIHGAVSADLRSRFYESQKPRGYAFGISEKVMPQTYSAFYEYYRSMINSIGSPNGLLAITPAARSIAEALFSIKVKGIPTGPVGKVAAAALMPPAARQAYDLAWGIPQRATWLIMKAGLKRL